MKNRRERVDFRVTVEVIDTGETLYKFEGNLRQFAQSHFALEATRQMAMEEDTRDNNRGIVNHGSMTVRKHR